MSILEDVQLHAVFGKATAFFLKKEKTMQQKQKKRSRWEIEENTTSDYEIKEKSADYLEEINGMDYFMGIEFDEKVN